MNFIKKIIYLYKCKSLNWKDFIELIEKMESNEELEQKESIDDSLKEENKDNLNLCDDLSSKCMSIINKDKEKWSKAKELLEKVKLLEDINDLSEIILELAKLNHLVGKRREALPGLNEIITTLKSENEDFLSKTLNTVHYIAELALRLDNLFPTGEINLLLKYSCSYVTYTSEEIAWMISMGFFCLYDGPIKNFDMPDPINFIQWYEDKDKIYIQKFKFLMNYFELFRLEEIEQKESMNEYRKISFERISFSKERVHELNDEYWANNDLPLCSVKIMDDSLVEDNEGTLMVDFANRYIGGGVMRKGSVQEEILFIIYPEFLASRVFWAKMEASEAIVIVGIKRFSNYSGYSSKTKFEGAFEDKQSLDNYGRIDRAFVAIDSLRFKGMKFQVEQFYKSDTLRDLNKAYIGFIGDRNDISEHKVKDVTTGRWGWGAYNGNSELKFCLQWIAASANKRNMNFTTFKERDCSNLELIYNIYKDKSIADLFKDLIELREFVKDKDKGKAMKSKKDLGQIVYKFMKRKI